MLAGHQRHMLEEAAVGADGLRHLQAEGAADLEILLAMAGGGVDEAGALLDGDMLAGQQRHVEVVAAIAPRVAAVGAFQVAAFRVGERVMAGDAGPFGQGRPQRIGHQQALADVGQAVLARVGDLDQHIVHIRPVADRPVARHGPWRGRPDDHRGPIQLLHAGIDDGEGHVDLGRGVVVIFDLGLGQGGLFHRRPHHRLGTPVQRAGHGNAEQFGDDARLRLVRHGGVGIVPVADHAQALELLALAVDPVGGELAAFAAELHRVDLVLVAAGSAVLLLDLPFDGQAVAVPARHIGRVPAHHLLGPDDHVLQDLVHRRAGVDVAVGIRRPVVQHELGATGRILAQAAVQVGVLPAGQPVGLAARQVGLHGKVGARQKQGGAVVARTTVVTRIFGRAIVGHCGRCSRARRSGKTIWTLR